ncbi:hypothetical protein ACLOJK_005760 [Asimina triloba]
MAKETAQANLYVGREGRGETSRHGMANKITPTTINPDKEAPTAVPFPLATISERRSWSSTISFLLFSLHLFLTFVLAVYLTVRALLAAFHPVHWYPPLLASSLSALLFAFAWLAAVLRLPETTIAAAFWLSPLLTFAAGMLAVAVGTGGSLTVAAFAIVFGIVQSLYACWVRRRREYAARILSTSLSATASASSALTKYVGHALLAAFAYSCLWVSAVGGIVSWGCSFLAVLFLLALLASITWTMQTIKNVIHASVARVGYLHFLCGVELEARLLFQHMGSRQMIGSICLGSALVPIICVLRGAARAMALLSGDADEFMFSCVDCYSGVAERLIACGNRWALVHVGMFGKPFVEASGDVWGALVRNGMEPVIDSDVTGAFCLLCGAASGAACAILCGAWTLAVEKSYATAALVHAFLIGYFMSRISMAWPQACVSAYYVVYTEIPQSQQFDYSTLRDRIRRLQR